MGLLFYGSDSVLATSSAFTWDLGNGVREVTFEEARDIAQNNPEFLTRLEGIDIGCGLICIPMSQLLKDRSVDTWLYVAIPENWIFEHRSLFDLYS